MAGKSDKPGVFVYFVAGADHELKISIFFDLACGAGSSARDLRGQKMISIIFPSPRGLSQNLRGRKIQSQI